MKMTRENALRKLGEIEELATIGDCQEDQDAILELARELYAAAKTHWQQLPKLEDVEIEIEPGVASGYVWMVRWDDDSRTVEVSQHTQTRRAAEHNAKEFAKQHTI